MRRYLLLVILVFFSCSAQVFAQVEISGTVYDRSQLIRMPGVSVISTSGVGTVTDTAGHYLLHLTVRDSIYFSYLGKATPKYPVKVLNPDIPFDMSLQVDADTMQSVLVWSHSYKEDSLANRLAYQKVFDYSKSYVTGMKTNNRGTGFGVGLDMGMLFDGGRNRRMEAFQERLENEEKDKYIDHRFTKSLVRRVTGLESPALDTFMREYRPTYEYLQSLETDYQFYKYIFDSGKFFAEIWRKEHPDDKTSLQAANMANPNP